jgi:hypothetical protein
MAQHEQDPEKVLADYKWTYLQCRVDRHLWQRDPAFELIDPRTIERTQVCRACMMERYTWVDRYTFERVIDYRYRPPKGYRTSGTELKLADFRERLDREAITKALKSGKVHGAELDAKSSGQKATAADAGSATSSAAEPAAGSAG